MSNGTQPPEMPRLICAKCHERLVPGKVTVKYLGNTFPLDLLKCPVCAAAYVPELLATGKMLTVEQALEDK